jgi:hypothetical protein
VHVRTNTENNRCLIFKTQIDFPIISNSVLRMFVDFTDLHFLSLRQLLVDSDLQASCELLTFMSYASQLISIIRMIILHQCSHGSIDPNDFLYRQYLINILHSSEFLMKYIYRTQFVDCTVLVEIFMDLSRLFSSMKHHMCSYQVVCQSLFHILQTLHQRQTSTWIVHDMNTSFVSHLIHQWSHIF